MRSFLVRRTVWTVFAIYLLLTASFFTVALTPDPNQQLVGLLAATEAMQQGEDANAAAQEAIAAYAEARNRDRPLLDRYRDWVVGYATFDWGWSYAYSEPVEDVVADAVPVTLTYLVPALLISWFLSLLGGLYAALRRGGVLDRVGRGATYLGVGVPAVVVVMLLQVYVYPETSLPRYDAGVGPLAAHNLAALAVPAAIVTFSMAVMQWRMVRSESLDLLNREFVTALRADGADDGRLGRHVLKNAAAPLVAVFNAEALAVLFLTIYVIEQFLGIPGLGSVTLTAFEDRDIGLILATVLIAAFAGLLGNFLSDVISAVVDPRASS